MIISGGGIGISRRLKEQIKMKNAKVRVRLRDVLAPANKEGTDHAKENQIEIQRIL